MKIFLNGKEVETENTVTLLELVQKMKLPAELVACELNLKIVKRNDYARTKISEGDQIEILQMIGGG